MLSDFYVLILAGPDEEQPKDFYGVIKNWPWHIIVPVALLLFAVFLAWRRYRLFRLLKVPYFKDESPAWSAFKALFTCLTATLRRPSSEQLFNMARAFTEYTILLPRPETEATDKDSIRKWKIELSKWKLERKLLMREAFETKPDEDIARTITVPSPFDIYAREERLTRYFTVLREMGFYLSDDRRDRFITRIKIESGYIVPIHLLRGLLARFDQDWTQLMSEYEKDRESAASGQTLMGSHQLFTFYCWLLWGPSIPMCGNRCFRWNGSMRALQFGFGDENNSLPLLAGKHSADDENARFEQLQAEAGGKTVRAFSVVAFPRWSLSDSRKETPRATLNADPDAPTTLQNWKQRAPKLLRTLVPAQRHLTYPDMGTGLVLDYVSHSSAEGDVPRYYSAYLWILFVLCDGSGKPKHGMNSSPWLGIIPFFEHANIADEGSRELSMRQLAAKVVHSLGELAMRGGNRVDAAGRCLVETRRPFEEGYLTYACAFDHTGCSLDDGPASTISLTKERKEGRTLAGMVEELLECRPDLRQRVIFDADQAPQAVRKNLRDTQDAFASCHLPDVIESLYRPGNGAGQSVSADEVASGHSEGDGCAKTSASSGQG